MAYLKRPNFFPNQFLQAQDLQDEQAYHREMRWRLNQHLYSPGILFGLDVAATGTRELTIHPGAALDSLGREIVIVDPEKLSLPASAAAGATLTLAIHYTETQDPTDVIDGNPRRLSVVPDPQVFPNPQAAAVPADGTFVVLGRVTLDGNGNIPATAVKPDGRVPVGPAIPDRSVPFTRLRARTDEEDAHIEKDDTLTIPFIDQGTTQPGLVFFDVFCKTVGGKVTWSWEVSHTQDGGVDRHLRNIIVKNISSPSIPVDVHYKTWQFKEA